MLSSVYRPLRVLAVLALLALNCGSASPSPRDAAGEIDSLLAFVGRQQGIAFIRNGASHTAAQAESHLRMKRRRGGSRIKTAEDFITLCASRSTFTGSPYRVRYADGSVRSAEAVLTAELRRLRGQGE